MKKYFITLVISSFYFFSYSQSDGTLDPSFGNAGIVTADNSNNNSDEGNDLLLMADKGIIIGGTSYLSNADFSFCAFKSSGILNPAFGIGGKLLVDIDNGSNDYLNALAVTADQKIVGAGYSYSGNDESLVVIRLDASGSLDNSFGTDGIVKLNPAMISIAYDVVIQPDHKIVIAGSVDDGLTPIKALIIRLNEDGTIDGAFGDGGVWEVSPDPSYDSEAYSVALQEDGKILIGGYQDLNGDDQFAVGRILPAGSMDVSFDVFGWAVRNLTADSDDIIHAIAVQNDGKILLGGESNGEVAVSRLNTNGSDDSGFGTNGTFTDPLLANDDVLYSVVLQPDNMILAAGGGSIDDNVDFLLMRLTPDGILDPAFGTNGVVYTNFNGSNDYAHSILLQADEKIVAGGSAFNSYFTDFALARYGTGFTEIENAGGKTGVDLYPNPSDGTIFISTNQNLSESTLYEITDITGRKIISGVIVQSDETISLQMGERPAGIYLVELRKESSQEVIMTEKMLIR